MPWSPLLMYAVALAAITSHGASQTTTRVINIPSGAPSDAYQIVDPSFPGFAFEQASFYNYSFNSDEQPNVFSQNLVNSVLSRTGGTPLLRVGGTSGDKGRYDPNQRNATNYPATEYGPRFDGDLVIGPSFFNAFDNWPEAKFEFNVPFANTTRSRSVLWAEQGLQHIGAENLYALEIGNEPNYYQFVRDGGVDEYARRYQAFQQRLQKAIPSLNNKRIFQALDSAANSRNLPTRDVFEAGLNGIATSIKQVAYHYYQGHGSNNLVELQDWMRHSTTVRNVTNFFVPQIQYLQNEHKAIDFAFTETGYNVGGGGNDTIGGNNLATALWAVDFQLFCMTVNVARVNWQQILRSSLTMWRPVKVGNKQPQVTPNFYSQPFVADFIGKSGNTRVMELGKGVGSGSDDLLTAYAAYDGDKLSRVALVNLEVWTSEQRGPRPNSTFTLRGLPGNTRQVVVHHLNAPDGALASKGLTFSGLEWTFESRGRDSRVKNDSLVLDVVDGNVDVYVPASSAAMVVL